MDCGLIVVQNARANQTRCFESHSFFYAGLGRGEIPADDVYVSGILVPDCRAWRSVTASSDSETPYAGTLSLLCVLCCAIDKTLWIQWQKIYRHGVMHRDWDRLSARGGLGAQTTRVGISGRDSAS